MLDASKSFAGPVEALPSAVKKAKEQQETLDNLIKQTLTSDSFLSFKKADKSPTQWLHLLDTLDQQNMNLGVCSSKLENTLDSARFKQEEIAQFDPKALTQSASVKGANTFGRGLQTSEDKFPSLKFPDAMVAIAQAAKDIPGWPLMSNKMMMSKCEKCSQEFMSPLNQRRHMRAIHRKPLHGEKEDSRKKVQIAAFWDKLTAEEAWEILSFKNLSFGDLSAASLVESLSTSLQQPGFLSLPQSYTKVAMLLLDIVQNKPSKLPLSSELFIILDDASEKNMLHGVTSSSMQRCLFGSDPGRVGLETKNLISSLGFLVELRLVKAWMDDKDAEALRCQKALVEEEEAAQKKRVKLQERRRQKKMRQKESKEKDKKAVESSSCLQELNLEFFPHESDSPTTTTPSSSDSLEVDANPHETSLEHAPLDCGGHNCTEGEQSRYVDHQEELDSQTICMDQTWESRRRVMQFRLTDECGVGGGVGRKDGRQCEITYLPTHAKQRLSNDRNCIEQQAGDQMPRKPYGSSSQDFSKMGNNSRFSHYREKFQSLKKLTSMAGSGHVVWTKKALQASDVSQQHDENVEHVLREIVNEALASTKDKNTRSTSLQKSRELSRNYYLSLDSIMSHSSSSITARVGVEDHEETPLVTATGADGSVGTGSIVIGSVTIPLGESWSGSFDSKTETKYLRDVKLVQDLSVKVLPTSSRSAALSSEGTLQLSRTDSLDATRETSLTWKDAPPYQPICENSLLFKGHVPTLPNKPGVLKVWRPVIERNDAGIETSEGQDQDAASSCREKGIVEIACCASIQSKFDIPRADGDISFVRHQYCEAVAEPEGGAGCKGIGCTGDLAIFLHQRWDEATSLSDAVYHHELDALDNCSVP